MKVELSKEQCRNLAEFIDINLLDAIRNDPGIDNLLWVESMIGAKNALDKAVEYEQEQEAQVGKDMNVPRWISMEEQTPETSDLVLVIANGKPRENIELRDAILIASYWADEGWIADGFDGWDGLDVSHWMPLPEGPKEG